MPMLLFFSAFFFFRCECLLGTWWYASFWSFACFHSLYAALLLRLGTFVFCLSSFPFLPVLNNAVSYFLSGTGAVRAVVFLPYMSVLFEEFHFLIFLRY